MATDADLMYTCSLIEMLGRARHLRRSEVVAALGEETVRRIYSHAGVLHCEPIESVADRFCELCAIGEGDFDNVGACKYDAPGYWTMGDVYARLIEDVSRGDAVGALLEVYGSWIDAALSNYNSDLYYQPRDYLKASYEAGEPLAE